MPLLLLLIFLLFNNWFFSEVLAFIPIELINLLSSAIWWVLLLGFLFLLSWLLGD